MSMTDSGSPTAAIEALRKRVDELESVQAINQLMTDYMYACDRPSDKGHYVGILFAPDGKWASFGELGKPTWGATGYDELKKKFDRNVERMPFSAHYCTNSAVTVDGDTATGKWMYLQPCTYRDGTALWTAGEYANKFVRIDGKWLIAELTVSNYFTTPYDKGWAVTQEVDTP
jgi:hypothetical protein